MKVPVPLPLSTKAALPGRPVAVNAGMEGAVVFNAVREAKDDFGFNAATEEYGDLIAANQVGDREGGFDSDRNALSLFWKGGGQELEMAPKVRLARQFFVAAGSPSACRTPARKRV